MSQRCRRRAEGIIYLTLFTYTARTTWDTASSPIEHFFNSFSLTDNNPTSPHLSCAIYYYLQNRIMACIPSDKKVQYSNLSATSPHNSPPPLKMCSITIELVTRRPCLLPVWWWGHGTGLKLIQTTWFEVTSPASGNQAAANQEITLQFIFPGSSPTHARSL